MSPTSPSNTSLVERLRDPRIDGAVFLRLEAADRIEALEARNRELEAGLRPFAGMTVISINCRDDSWQIRIPETEPQPTFAMFDAARALIASRPKP